MKKMFLIVIAILFVSFSNVSAQKVGKVSSESAHDISVERNRARTTANSQTWPGDRPMSDQQFS